jgi:hypothetical protein
MAEPERELSPPLTTNRTAGWPPGTGGRERRRTEPAGEAVIKIDGRGWPGVGSPLFIHKGGAGFAPREEARSTDSAGTI